MTNHWFEQELRVDLSLNYALGAAALSQAYTFSSNRSLVLSKQSGSTFAIPNDNWRCQ